MKRFARLYAELDGTTSTREKLAALGRYYVDAPPADAAWATYFLSGGKPRQLVPTKVLRAAVLHASGLEDWMFEECYQAVGDMAETIALVLPPARGHDDSGLALWVEQRLAPLRGAETSSSTAVPEGVACGTVSDRPTSPRRSRRRARLRRRPGR